MELGEPLLHLLDQIHCGGFLLDQSGKVTCFNGCAGRFLEKEVKAGVQSSSRSWNENVWASKILLHLLGKTFLQSSNEVPVTIKNSQERPLIAYFFKIPKSKQHGIPKVLVLIDLNEYPHPKAEVLKQMFGLTGAEATLAIRIALGDSIQDVAAARQITLGTARVQLKSVLYKTRSRRQAELVALLTRLALIP